MLRRESWRKIGVALVTAAFLITISPSISSAVGESEEPIIHDKVDTKNVVDFASDDMSAEVSDAITRIQLENKYHALNRFIWDGDSGVLEVHITEPTPELEAELREIVEPANTRFIENLYPLSVLNEEATRIAELKKVAGFTIGHAGATLDSSAVQVGIVDLDLSDAVVERLEKAIASDFPLEFVEGRIGQANNRMNQTSLPTWGGAYASAGSGLYCSTGFWVVQPGVPWSTVAMLTADHCNPWTKNTWNISTTTIGTAVSTSAGGADILKLDTTNGAIGAVFYGPYYSNVGLAVKGFNWPAVGQT